MSKSVVGSTEAASKSDSSCQEKSLLVSSLNQVTECLQSTVSESRISYSVTQHVQDYVSLDNPKGIRRLFAPMSAYAKALTTLGYKRWTEVEECISRNYRDEDIQEVVENLLSVEDSYKDFVTTVEKNLEKYEETQAFMKTVGVGDFLPAGLTLSLADGTIATLDSYWKRSKFTLLILMRHFG